MSLPKFPAHDPSLTREAAINQIISSIAMDELGLSHIINAEGEKLQYALGTIEGIPAPEQPATIEDLLDLNESIQKTLDSTMMYQFVLKEKLVNALSASVMRGPKGDVGTILGSYDTLEELEKAHPKGEQGDAYLVAGDLYVWNTETEKWEFVGRLIGPPGPEGPRGADSVILAYYKTLADLEREHKTGNVGDCYIVGEGDLYTWSEAENKWIFVGNLQGPEGKFESGGTLFTISDSNDSMDVTYEGNVKLQSSTLDIKVNPASSTITIENPTFYENYVMFNSIRETNLSTDILGQRNPVIAVGQGYSPTFDTNLNPIRILGTQIIPIKAFTKGTITGFHVSLSTVLRPHSSIDLVVYAQLFAASTLTSSEFFPVDDTYMILGTIAYGAPIGTLYAQEKANLSIPVEPGSQYMIGFYCTSAGAISSQDVLLGGWMKVEHTNP